MSSDWFPLGVTGSTFTRVSLDFGLRGANKHFLELVVPGVGGARFVRQISWAIAGLAMRDTLRDHGERHRATPLANAIEALGCKAEYVRGTNVSSRIIGRRAFARDGKELSDFKRLKDRRHYVQNTFRGTVVRTLRDKVGLGFARGARFDTMTLEPVGERLAAALLDESRIGQGNASLRTWLRKWVSGQKEAAWGALREVLSPELPSKSERTVVRHRLLGVDGAFAQKRRDLAGVLESEKEFPGIDKVVRELRRRKHEPYARQIELARAFGELLDACIQVVVRLSAGVEDQGQLPLAMAAKFVAVQLSQVKSCAKSFLRTEGTTSMSSHPEAHRIANLAMAGSHQVLLEHLLRREAKILELVDGRVHQGPLFRNLDGDAADEEDDELVSEDAPESTRTFRLERFHQLLRDTRGR